MVTTICNISLKKGVKRGHALTSKSERTELGVTFFSFFYVSNGRLPTFYVALRDGPLGC